LIPSEPERPTPLRKAETKDRIRAAIESLPPREQTVIGPVLLQEATMKQIGAAIGVNESRVSQLHARAIRRLRGSAYDVMSPAETVTALRTAILEFQQKPPWPKQRSTAEGSRRPMATTTGFDAARSRRPLHERSAYRSEQVGQPERFGHPAAALSVRKRSASASTTSPVTR
jgi:RNA polymerase sigma factor for flagellar operon FliA